MIGYKSYFYLPKTDRTDRDLFQKVSKVYTFKENKDHHFITFLPEVILKFNLLDYCDTNARKVVDNYFLSGAVKLESTPIYRGFLDKNIRDYQLVTVDYILKNRMTLLADSMGLGKTAQIVSAMSAYAYSQNRDIYHAVVVCPAHLKNVWIDEIYKFATVNFYIRKYIGKKYSENITIERDSKKMFIVNLINYDILEHRLVEIEKNSKKYDFVVFDESHYLKNLKAKRTKASYKLVSLLEKNGRLIFSSGTPVTKSPIDLYPVLNMADHPIAQNWYYYATKFCDARKEKVAGREVWKYGTSKAGYLNLILKETCMIRRKKEDVLSELPEKTKQVISLEPSEVFKKFIDEENLLLATNKIDISDFEKKDINIPLSLANKLAKIRQEIALRKIPFIVEQIQEIIENNEKVVIFAYHHVVIDALKKVFDNSLVITGKVEQEERTKIIDTFQYEDDPKILIANFSCAGTGITLTKANYAVFVELDWIPSTISQAEDRIHRLGQTKNTFIYYVVVEKTLEHYIAKKMIDRERQIEKVIDFKK